MAHVIVTESLRDDEFLKSRVNGLGKTLFASMIGALAGAVLLHATRSIPPIPH